MLACNVTSKRTTAREGHSGDGQLERGDMATSKIDLRSVASPKRSKTCSVNHVSSNCVGFVVLLTEPHIDLLWKVASVNFVKLSYMYLRVCFQT